MVIVQKTQNSCTPARPRLVQALGIILLCTFFFSPLVHASSSCDQSKASGNEACSCPEEDCTSDTIGQLTVFSCVVGHDGGEEVTKNCVYTTRDGSDCECLKPGVGMPKRGGDFVIFDDLADLALSFQ